MPALAYPRKSRIAGTLINTTVSLATVSESLCNLDVMLVTASP